MIYILLKTSLQKQVLTYAVLFLIVIQISFKILQWTGLDACRKFMVKQFKKHGNFMDEQEELREFYRRGILEKDEMKDFEQ